MNTLLRKNDTLPLTCSRKGTCCHGNQVWLNPWELRSLAEAKQMNVHQFQSLFCDLKGIRLKFDGEMDIRNKKACNLYNSEIGCTVHENRPLACRLFPLGRQIQENEIHYFYQGKSFPCIDGCKEVLDLPQLTVENYLSGQQTLHFESAQNLYLEVMQNTADIAFMLLLETDLTQSEKENTWLTWKKIANENMDDLVLRISPDWLNALIAPSIEFDIEDPSSFVHQHEILLQTKAQEIIDQFNEGKQACDLSVVLFTTSLILAQSIGAETKSIANLWVKIARENLG